MPSIKLISREPQPIVVGGVTFLVKPLSQMAMGFTARGIQEAYEAGDWAKVCGHLAGCIVKIDDPQAEKMPVAEYIESIEDVDFAAELMKKIIGGNKLSDAETKNSNSSSAGNSTVPASSAALAAKVESVSEQP